MAVCGQPPVSTPTTARRPGAAAHEELRVLLRVDVVGDHRHVEGVAQAQAQRLGERGLPRADGAADADLERAPEISGLTSRKSRVSSVACRRPASSSPGANDHRSSTPAVAAAAASRVMRGRIAASTRWPSSWPSAIRRGPASPTRSVAVGAGTRRRGLGAHARAAEGGAEHRGVVAGREPVVHRARERGRQRRPPGRRRRGASAGPSAGSPRAPPAPTSIASSRASAPPSPRRRPPPRAAAPPPPPPRRTAPPSPRGVADHERFEAGPVGDGALLRVRLEPGQNFAEPPGQETARR